jgi:sterol O-acyltransferase
MLLYDDENYKTLFNIFAVCLLFWGISMALNDMEVNGAPNHDLLVWGLVNDVYPFFLNLFLMWGVSVVIIPLAHIWVEAKHRITRIICMFAYLGTLAMFCYFASHLVANRMAHFSMPMAFGFMAELARVCMKMHSYLREKLYWEHFKGEYACKPISSGRWSWIDVSIPERDYFFSEVGKYIYFLFVPTLLFRERYPRTTRIRWEFVIQHFLEAVGIVYYAFLIFRTIIPHFEHSSSTPIDLSEFVRLSFKCM